ncbi:acetylglutamate kinase [Aliikangiella marina]|uniref:Acetylglutamate kinase n=1 Tax=Aliikangiella marina TaxID=1712262 RepID=A0A545T2N6_9GAMM|nr:acetylglutamate kinase [Aliikangiella marina]TQV71469.1 acetylglutamate kinase [Aliikangiella marina]
MNQLKSNLALSTQSPTSFKPKVKETIIQLLANLANPKEIQQYLDRFVDAGKTHFAVIKVGGAILDNDLDNLCSSLAFLEQIGLFPIVIHGAGPQLSKNLAQKSITSEFVDGQRITTPEVLSVAKKTFIQQNLKLANKLQALGVKTASITSGVFYAKQSSQEQLGLVGEINNIDLEPIKSAIESGAIPILSSLAETETGQVLNVNADNATNQLAIAIEPYKIIFLTQTGGILNEKNKVISSINLVTDYSELIAQPWLHSGMKLKVKQIAEILSQLPSTASVSITTPAHLAKELFTHKGSGTLLRRGESIMTHESVETIKTKKLKALLESSFKKQLDNDYFEKLKVHKAFVTYCYRAAAIVTIEDGIPFLDKFVVDDSAKGEGLGKAVWEKMVQSLPAIYWRAKPDNPINQFYFKKAHGHMKSKDWNIYWYGLNDFAQIEQCINAANNKAATLN